jgi:hypothetical protein
MPPALAYAPVPEIGLPEVDLLAAFQAHTAKLGLRGVNQDKAARGFLRRWPDPQAWADEPLAIRLALPQGTRSFLMFLLLGGHLRPGYDYLVRRKLPSFWRELPHGPMAADMTGFLAAAGELGFTERTRVAVASQVVGRVLIQTGRGLGQLTETDLDELLGACRQRQDADGTGLRHYQWAVHTTRRVLFHLGVLDAPPVNAMTLLRQSFTERLRAATPALRPPLVAYLDRLTATHTPLDGHRGGQPAQRVRRASRPDRRRPARAGRAGPTPTHRDLPERDRRRGQLPHRRAAVCRRTARSGARGALPTQRHHRVGLARGTDPTAGVLLRHPETAPPAAALPDPGPGPAAHHRAAGLPGPAGRRRAAAGPRHRAARG